MHLSSGDIKLYIDSAIPNRLLLRYLTHFLCYMHSEELSFT